MTEYRPIAEWLVAARQSQIDPSTGEPWTQDKFLEELLADTGWRLHRSNLSAYENGRQTPKGPTLAKFVAFWQGRGVSGPDLSPKSPPQSETESLVAALRAQTDAINSLAMAGADRDTSVPADLASAIMALVEELRASRLERASLEERVAALETAARLADRAAGGTGAVLPAHQGSME